LSVSALDSSVKSLGSSPSAQDLLGLGQGIAGVATSFKGFSDTTAGKC
jgi:hypothetical protein